MDVLDGITSNIKTLKEAKEKAVEFLKEEGETFVSDRG